MPELAETIDRRSDFIDSESVDDPDGDDDEPEVLIAEHGRNKPAEFQDALAKRAGDILDYLRDRSERYGAMYPFEVDDEQRLVVLRELTQSRRLYLLLLSCAMFRYVKDRADITSFAARFEFLSVEVLQRMLPDKAEVHLFGRNPMGSERYPGKLYDKVSLLAQDLGEQLLATPKHFEKGDSGDGGIDLVAWIPLGDPLPGRITIFAQAACTPKWVTKQHSSSSSAWSPKMTLTADPTNMIFIPYDYRRPGGEWYNPLHIHKSAVVDRQRIMTLAATGDNPEDPVVIGPELAGVIDLGSLDLGRQQQAADL
jgi:hypothetical protein